MALASVVMTKEKSIVLNVLVQPCAPMVSINLAVQNADFANIRDTKHDALTVMARNYVNLERNHVILDVPP